MPLLLSKKVEIYSEVWYNVFIHGLGRFFYVFIVACHHLRGIY